MKLSEKLLLAIQTTKSNIIQNNKLSGIHAKSNKQKFTSNWIGFLRGVLASNKIEEAELEPLIMHTSEFLQHVSDDDAIELIEELEQAWPDVSDEAEGIIENILEFREDEAVEDGKHSPFNYYCGFLKGIACDNKITVSELNTAIELCQTFPTLLSEPRVSDLMENIKIIIADGIVDEDEQLDVCNWISRIVGDSFADTGLTSSMDMAATPEFEVAVTLNDLKNKNIVVTGIFADDFIQRDVIEALEAEGSRVTKSVSRKTDYVVFGNKGNKHWTHTHAGIKLMKAYDLQAKTGKPKMIRESEIRKLFSKD